MARRLLVLNGLAILGVILNHSASWGFIAMFWWTDRYLPVSVPNFDQMGSIAYYSLRFIEQIITFSVPVFLFVSGFFIAFAVGRSRVIEGWRVAGSRIVTLVVPYLIWSVVMFIFAYVQNIKYSLLEYAKLLFIGGAADPYYYIPLLVQLLLLAPLLILAARNHWKLLLVIVAIIQLFVQSIKYPFSFVSESSVIQQFVALTPGWFFPAKMFWFVFGVVFGLHITEIKQWATRYRWILLTILVILLPLGMLEWELILRISSSEWVGYYDTALDSLYAFMFILCFISFDRVVPPYSQRLFNIGAKSYGIYLVHALVLIIASKLVYHVIPSLLAYQILFQPLLIVAGLGIPLLMMIVVKKSPARRYYRYLFG